MFLKNRFFIILFSIAAISALGILVDVLYGVAIAALCLFAIVSIADAVMLMTLRLEGERSIASKLDLGEENIISFNVKIKKGRLKGAYVIDEIPTEFLTDTDRHDMEKDRDGDYGCHYAITPSCPLHDGVMA